MSHQYKQAASKNWKLKYVCLFDICHTTLFSLRGVHVCSYVTWRIRLIFILWVFQNGKQVAWHMSNRHIDMSNRQIDMSNRHRKYLGCHTCILDTCILDTSTWACHESGCIRSTNCLCLRLACSLKSYVSFEEYRLLYRALLQIDEKFVDIICMKPDACYGVPTISRLLTIIGPFAKEPCKTDDILQKRPVILRSLLMVGST